VFVSDAQAQSPARSLAQAGMPGSPFLGSVPAGAPAAQPVALTLFDTIKRALEHNLGVLTAEESVGRAEGGRWLALSELLPNVSGRISEVRQEINLAAYGFPLPPGTPSLVGPFNVFDARVSVSQGVVDLRAMNAVKAENHRLAAAKLNVRGARDLVVLVSGNMYLEALAAQARVQSAEAQLQTAQTVLDQATRMKEAGMVAGIDVLRADVQRSTEQLRLTAAKNTLETTKLQLARIIGLPPGQTFTMSTEVPDLPAPDMSIDQALDRAYRTRPDYLAALERLHAAEAERQSAFSELLPSLRVNADYGRIGHGPGDALGTYSVSTTVNVPIFNGGRSKGRIMQADADLRQRRADVDDLKSAVDYSVRSTFLELQASREQVTVAAHARDLAAQQLTQARDRFAAGVASNIEVVQAQEAVATSNEQYISAFYAFNSAKALLARDLGEAEAMAFQLLGGGR
jgi:outer membrane protein TolC